MLIVNAASCAVPQYLLFWLGNRFETAGVLFLVSLLPHWDRSNGFPLGPGDVPAEARRSGEFSVTLFPGLTRS